MWCVFIPFLSAGLLASGVNVRHQRGHRGGTSVHHSTNGAAGCLHQYQTKAKAAQQGMAPHINPLEVLSHDSNIY